MQKYNSIEEMGTMLLEVWCNGTEHGPHRTVAMIEDIKFQIHVAVLKDMNVTDEEWIDIQEGASGDNPRSYHSLLNSAYYENTVTMTSQVFAYASIKQRYWTGIAVEKSSSRFTPIQPL